MIAAIGIGVGSSSVATAAQSLARVGFTANSAIALSNDKTDVQVVNNTPAEWTLTVRAYLLTAGSPAQRVPVAAKLPATIAAGDSATLTLAPVPSDVKKASGFVVVTATHDGETSVARRELVVAASAPTPKVTKWSGSNQRFTISGAASGVPNLPLDGSGCGSLEQRSHDVAITAGSQIAILRYKCMPGKNGNSAGLLFDTGGVDQVGQYTGTLQIGDKSVDLSYLKARSARWALLMILVGLAAALSRQIWSVSVRPVRRTDERLTLVGKDGLARQAEFQRRAGRSSYRVYDLVTAVAREIARLQNELAALRGWRVAFGWGSGNEQDRLNGVVDDAAKLDQVVQRWPALADDFRNLDAQVRAVEQPPDDPPPDDPPAKLAPFLMARARSLLAPLGSQPTTKELTIDEARALLDDVPKTTKALELLPVAAQLHEDVKQLPEPNELSDRDVWAEAHRLDRQILAELALAKDIAALEQAKVDALLVRARALVRQLPQREEGRLAAAQLQVPVVAEPAVALIAGAGRLAHTLWSALSLTRKIDLIWLLVAMATAVWSGLALYYVDKPWGRPADFVILFVWAFGTTTILTPLLSALEDVAAGALPLKKSTASADKPNP